MTAANGRAAGAARAAGDDAEHLKHHWDYISARCQMLDALLTRYISSLVYRQWWKTAPAFLRAAMVAIQSATDNAPAT